LAFKRRSRDITTRYSVPPLPQTQHTSLTTSLRIISDTSCAIKLKIENLLFTITSTSTTTTTSCRLPKLPVFYTTNSQTTLHERYCYIHVTNAFSFFLRLYDDGWIQPPALSSGDGLGIPPTLKKGKF
jgi:hypothetical protein